MMNKTNGLSRIMYILKNSDYYFSVIAFFYIAFVCLGTIISRTFFGKASATLEEFNLIVYVWMFFATIVYSVRKNRHIRVEILDTVLSLKSQKMLKILADVIWLVFMLYLLYGAVILVKFNWGRMAETPMLEIPVWILYLIVVIAFAAMNVSIAIQLFKKIKEFFGTQY